jgi:hypothetical protein
MIRTAGEDELERQTSQATDDTEAYSSPAKHRHSIRGTDGPFRMFRSRKSVSSKASGSNISFQSELEYEHVRKAAVALTVGCGSLMDPADLQARFCNLWQASNAQEILSALKHSELISCFGCDSAKFVTVWSAQGPMCLFSSCANRTRQVQTLSILPGPSTFAGAHDFHGMFGISRRERLREVFVPEWRRFPSRNFPPAYDTSISSEV